MPPMINLLGLKYGRLVVISPAKSKNSKTLWNCKCECGNIVQVSSTNLRAGHTQSCGCLSKEILEQRNFKHGQTVGHQNTRTYTCWIDMRRRCYNPKNKEYHNYGGRGVSVCSEWASFEQFLSDMGECPTDHTLDRLDVNGDYCLQNCRWSTRRQQSRNKRTNTIIIHNGQSKPLVEWLEYFGITWGTYNKRRKRGWTKLRAATTPKLV